MINDSFALSQMVWFNGISIIAGYLKPNHVYTYILDIWFVNIFADYIFKWAKIIFCKQLNGFKYCYIPIPIWHQSFVCTYINGYTYDFILKWVRTNLFAH